MEPKHIAELIDIVAEQARQGADWNDADIKRHSDLNRVLWDLARERGVKDEVDSILQERAAREIFEALDRL